MGRSALAEKVREYRKLLTDPGSSPAELRGLGRELGTLLLGPLQPRLGKAKRLMICPDGPLNLLPFAALVLSDGTWLAERLPSFQRRSRRRSSPRIGSSTRRANGSRRSRRSVIPATPVPRTSGSGPGPGLPCGGELGPLPATRSEVEAISGLFPERSRLYLGDQAREEEVKKLGLTWRSCTSRVTGCWTCGCPWSRDWRFRSGRHPGPETTGCCRRGKCWRASGSMPSS